MEINEQQLAMLLDEAVATARGSGEIIGAYRDSEVAVRKKGLGGSLAADVVTEVDIKVQTFIEQSLERCCEQYDIAFLGEERADDQRRFETDYFWSVDPMDGTLAFCEKREGYSVSIGLVRSDGEPVLGVVYDPWNDKLYHAAKGQGAWINGVRIGSQKGGHKESVNRKEKAVLSSIFDRSYKDDAQYIEVIRRLERFVKHHYAAVKGMEIIAQGGAALNACWVLERAPALYLKLPKERGGSLWDYAATAAIFAELNLPAFDIYGNPFDLNRRESTYMNHKGIIYASDHEIAKYIIEVLGA